nr:D-alanyl-D-alanine carboxypeptidase family protein [Cryobacterium tepidiphilum]
MSARVRRRRVAAVGLLILAVLAVGAGVIWGKGSVQAHFAPSATPDAAARPTPAPSAETPRPTPSATPVPAAVDTFDKHAHSIDDPASIWVVVNKQRPLNPKDFVPPDLVTVPVPHVWEPQLRKVASDAIVAMFADYTKQTGLKMQSQSAYRSYDSQVEVYTEDVKTNGQEAADSSTARPGTSEHQTGLTMDISALPADCSLAACFGDTPQGKWLAANAWKYGFLLRYPADKVAVTGYEYEPWHFRYIGRDLAKRMHETGITTLEEFFGLPAAPDYP